jgi:GDPmannose 4,6-dehydratase
MWMILQQKTPDDYVIATNETHSVKEFVEKAFDCAGLDWQDKVKVDKHLLRPLDVNFLQGDYTKAKKNLGWHPKVKFEKLVKIMVDEELDRWTRWQNGERFPWDAPNYPNENRILSRKLSIDM